MNPAVFYRVDVSGNRNIEANYGLKQKIIDHVNFNNNQKLTIDLIKVRLEPDYKVLDIKLDLVVDGMNSLVIKVKYHNQELELNCNIVGSGDKLELVSSSHTNILGRSASSLSYSLLDKSHSNSSISSSDGVVFFKKSQLEASKQEVLEREISKQELVENKMAFNDKNYPNLDILLVTNYFSCKEQSESKPLDKLQNFSELDIPKKGGLAEKDINTSVFSEHGSLSSESLAPECRDSITNKSGNNEPCKDAILWKETTFNGSSGLMSSLQGDGTINPIDQRVALARVPNTNNEILTVHALAVKSLKMDDRELFESLRHGGAKFIHNRVTNLRIKKLVHKEPDETGKEIDWIYLFYISPNVHLHNCPVSYHFVTKYKVSSLVVKNANPSEMGCGAFGQVRQSKNPTKNVIFKTPTEKMKIQMQEIEEDIKNLIICESPILLHKGDINTCVEFDLENCGYIRLNENDLLGGKIAIKMGHVIPLCLRGKTQWLQKVDEKLFVKLEVWDVKSSLPVPEFFTGKYQLTINDCRTIFKNFCHNFKQIRFNSFWLFVKTNKLYNFIPPLLIREDKQLLKNGGTVFSPSNLPSKESLRSFIAQFNFFHNAGRAHGDVKPENILVNGSGDIFLIDFDFLDEAVCRGTPIYWPASLIYIFYITRNFLVLMDSKMNAILQNFFKITNNSIHVDNFGLLYVFLFMQNNVKPSNNQLMNERLQIAISGTGKMDEFYDKYAPIFKQSLGQLIKHNYVDSVLQLIKTLESIDYCNFDANFLLKEIPLDWFL